MNHRNLITSLAIAALITVAVTTAGCTNTSPSATPTPIASQFTTVGNHTIFSSAAGFNITYPTKLKIDSNNSADTQVRIYVYLATNNTNNTSKLVDSVVVGTEAVDPKATSLDYATYALGKVNNYQNYKLLSNNTTNVGNKPSYTVVWQATVPAQLGTTAASVQNMTLKEQQTYVVSNNTAYVITYKAVPGDYDTYLAQARQIMYSFNLT